MKREIRDLFYSAFPKSDYLQYQHGSTNIILTAPHGGGMRPFNIPKRKYGKLKMDTYTRRLTNRLLSQFGNWEKPYYIISDLHRSRLDLNRDVREGAQGNRKAKKIWLDWNFILIGYKFEMITNYGKGLYIDIHSQSKTKSFQLGYNLSASNYRSVNRGGLSDRSTLDSLGKEKIRDMLFGPNSIAASLGRFGFEVFYPKSGESYYNGGRGVEEFSGGGLGGIQIECPTSVLKKDLDLVAEALYYGINRFKREFVD